MTVMITGGNGQLGRALVQTAPADRHCVAVDRAALDITDGNAVRACVDRIRPTMIINAAAYTAVDRAEIERDAAFAVNRDGAGNLARAAQAVGAAMVHISTDFVFDGTQSSPYAETAPRAPLGVYGASKAAGEDAVRAIVPDALIVRTAWVHAARGRNFVETMLRVMAERGDVRVVADQIGTPTHARSLARAIWGLQDAAETGTFHVTDAGVASWYDFAVAIAELALVRGILTAAPRIMPIATTDYPTAARRPAYSVLDKRRAWAVLGQPPRHWRDELATMLDERMTQ